MDSNGYNRSLFTTCPGECYICGAEVETARHEVIHGANRSLAKRYGLWINVCPRCHRNIHAEDNGTFRYLKEEAERFFEEEYPEKSFLEIFGRRYL